MIPSPKNKHNTKLFILSCLHSITFSFYIIAYSAFTEQRYYMLWQSCFILFKKWHASMGKYQKSTRRRFFIITDMVVCRKLARPLSARAPIYVPWQELISEAVTSWLMLYTSTAFYMLYIFRKVYHLGQDSILVLGSLCSGAVYMPQLHIWLWLLIIAQIKIRSKKSNN